MRRAWHRLMRFSPDDEQLADLAAGFEVLCQVGDTLLKAFVIGAAVYFAIEIGHGLLVHFGGR